MEVLMLTGDHDPDEFKAILTPGFLSWPSSLPLGVTH